MWIPPSPTPCGALEPYVYRPCSIRPGVQLDVDQAGDLVSVRGWGGRIWSERAHRDVGTGCARAVSMSLFDKRKTSLYGPGVSKTRIVALRLTEDEFAALQRQAGPNVSAFVRSRLDFDADPITELRIEIADLDRRLGDLERLADSSGY